MKNMQPSPLSVFVDACLPAVSVALPLEFLPEQKETNGVLDPQRKQSKRSAAVCKDDGFASGRSVVGWTHSSETSLLPC